MNTLQAMDSDVRRHLRIKALYGEVFGSRERQFFMDSNGLNAFDDGGGALLGSGMSEDLCELLAELLTLAQENYK